MRRPRGAAAQEGRARIGTGVQVEVVGEGGGQQDDQRQVEHERLRRQREQHHDGDVRVGALGFEIHSASFEVSERSR